MPVNDVTKPLALLFQEVEQETAALRLALERLDLRTKAYIDPKAFLVDLRAQNPTIAFLDLTTPKMDIAIAIVKTVRSVLGTAHLLVAIIKKGDKKAADRAKAAGASFTIEKPIPPKQLAVFLSKHLATDAISALLTAETEEPRLSKASKGPPIPEVPLPQIVGWHFEKLMPLLAQLSGSLERFDEIEVQHKYYAKKLAPWREEIVKMVKILRKSEEALDLLQSLRLYGGGASRALTVALSLKELSGLVTFKFNEKTGLPTQEPAKVLTYASRSGDHFGEDSRYHAVAFNAGLVFDLIALFAQTAGERKSTLLRAIEASYADAMQRIDRGLKAAKSVKDLAQDKHIISTMMMREAGKILMMFSYPDYFERRNTFTRKLIKPSLQHIAETEKYGVSHNIVGALICQVVPGLEKAYKAVLFFDYPFMLGDLPEDKDMLALAELCSSL